MTALSKLHGGRRRKPVRHRLCDLTGRRPLGAPLNQRGDPDALHCRPGARAYQRAARTIDELPVELTLYVVEGRDLKEIPGIGQAIAKKIRELLETCELWFYERLKAEFPAATLQFIDIPGVGPKTALRFCVELGITTVEELEAALKESIAADAPTLLEVPVGPMPSPF